MPDNSDRMTDIELVGKLLGLSLGYVWIGLTSIAAMEGG